MPQLAVHSAEDNRHSVEVVYGQEGSRTAHNHYRTVAEQVADLDDTDRLHSFAAVVAHFADTAGMAGRSGRNKIVEHRILVRLRMEIAHSSAVLAADHDSAAVDRSSPG